MAVLLVAFTSCSDLLGSEELQAELEKHQGKTKITIHCGNIINESNQPGYVVDGEVWSTNRTLNNNLNPDDIKSVEVLKEYEKWKKYGFPDDKPGVVVITTKKDTKN